MNYYYDIVVNFQDTNYMFYDWNEKDNIEFIKKIPIFQVTTNTLKDFISYNIIINEEILNTIKDKTKLEVDLENISKQQNLKGFFVRNLLEKIEEEPENKEKIYKAIEIGLMAFEK